MIPKVLHYCWFGGAPLNNIALMCIDSWRKYCPEYKIVEWNERNFDINSNTFVKEAYQNKKWAFVSDYVRLFILYNYGGIYLDTDVEIIKNIDSLLDKGSVVTGYQEDITIPAALMIAQSNNEWIKLLLSYYNDRHFKLKDGTFDMTTNSIIITVMSARECKFKIGDNYINYGNVCLLPTAYLAPAKKIKFISNENNKKDIYKLDPINTYAIHHAVGSWTPKTKIETIKVACFAAARLILTEPLYTKIKGFIMRRKMGI